MAITIETSFQAFNLSLEELQQARVLSPEQKMYYQTLLSGAAEQKLSLRLDPYHPLIFTQEDAYLRGQMDILAMLLDPKSTKITIPQNAVQTAETPTGE